MGILAQEGPIKIPLLLVSFLGPPQVIGGDDDEVFLALPDLFAAEVTVGAILEEFPQSNYIRRLAEGKDITNWSSILVYTLSLSDE